MSYYIGVDGGGTKTAYALFDENKNILSTVKTRGSNHEKLIGSFDEATDIIAGGIKELLSENGISIDDIEGILMGLSGIDHQFQHDETEKLLLKKGIKNFRIYNDGFIITKAGSPDGKGIGYNCGTGTCCNSIDSDGNMLQIGGFGYLSGDTGSGYWIAAEVCAAIHRDICVKARKTMMTEVFCEKAGIKPSPEEFLSCIPKIENEEKEKYCIYLTDTFFECANRGDEAALEITERMAQAGSELICAHLKMGNFREDAVNVVLSGSMNVKMPNEIYINLLKEKCSKNTDKKLNFIKLAAEPVTGCINWLLEK